MALKFLIVIEKDEIFNDNPTGTLRFGDVMFHRDLLSEKDLGKVYTRGGGSYLINDNSDTFVLYDESADFGVPKFEEYEWKEFKCPNWLANYKRVVYRPSRYSKTNEIDITKLLKYDGH